MRKDDRTEKATPKRREDARKKGQSARSVEFPQAVALAIGVLILPVVVPAAARALATDWRQAVLRMPGAEPATASGMIGSSFAHVALALLPLVVVLTVAGVAAQLGMVGVKPNPWKLKPKWSNISPKQGFKRLFSTRSLWELAKTAAKLGMLTLVTIGVWQAGVKSMAAGPAPLGTSLGKLGGATSTLLYRVAVLGAAIGIADAVISRRRFNAELRMTRHEVKEEMRHSEGNPLIRGEIRRKQARISRLRMIAEVAHADVVLTNPAHLAVALAYDRLSPAPVVVAKGAGEIAERIRAEARLHRVPIKENKPLARALFRSVDVGEAIPVQLYRAVAEVLAAVYRARRGVRA